VAERTGLEPATPGVTGRYSNQLNYRSSKKHTNEHQGLHNNPCCFPSLVTAKKALVYSIFQRFTSLKFRDACGLDFNGLLGARIAASACGPLADREGAKAISSISSDLFTRSLVSRS
jgi:hypothetical protein